MFSVKLILLIILGVAAENASEDCIYFDNDSGFVKLSPLGVREYPVKIRMEVKAYNCDDISVTMAIGNKYKYTKAVLGRSLRRIRDRIDDYNINNPCNGLWHRVTLDLFQNDPLLRWNDDFGPYADFNVKQYKMRCWTVDATDPTDVIFTSTEGAIKLAENTVRNVVLVLQDSYFILEMVGKTLYWKLKAGGDTSKRHLWGFGNLHLCNGEWHKIAVLQRGDEHRMVDDTNSEGEKYGTAQNFTAPLYLGQHPFFKGCPRSLHINGVAPEINGSDFNEFAELGSCGNVNGL